MRNIQPPGPGRHNGRAASAARRRQARGCDGEAAELRGCYGAIAGVLYKPRGGGGFPGHGD